MEQLAIMRDEIMGAVNAFKTQINNELTQLKTNGVVDPETKDALVRVKTRLDELQALMNRPDLPNGALVKSIGAAVAESDTFKTWAQRGWHKGGVSVSFDSLFGPEQKTTITSTAVGSSTPGILVPERVGGIIKPAIRRLRVRDLLPRFPTAASAIEYVKENVFTNNASVQTEASDKAESALTFTIASAPVRTIAHWIPATRQILDDFNELMNYIDQRLIDGLKDQEDFELLRATGTGVHLTGLIPSATAYDTARNVTSDNKLDTLNHAMSQLEASEYFADGIVMNPADWRKVQLLKTEEGGANKGSYLMGGPGMALQSSAWQTPVAVTNAMPAGTFLVGAFSIAAAIFDRMQARIDVSTEHSDFFVKNLVAVRAEERLALAIYRPTSFVYGAFPS